MGEKERLIEHQTRMIEFLLSKMPKRIWYNQHNREMYEDLNVPILYLKDKLMNDT